MSSVSLKVRELRRHRDIRGLSNADLARLSGLSESTVSAAMNGHKVAARTVRALADGLSKAELVPLADDLVEEMDHAS